MKLKDIDKNHQEVNEAPMGHLDKLGNFIGSKVGAVAPGLAAKSSGNLESGKLANQLHKEFNYYLGTSRQQPIGKVLIDFLKSKKLPTKNAQKIVNDHYKFIDNYYKSHAMDKPTGDWKTSAGNFARDSLGIDPRAAGLGEERIEPTMADPTGAPAPAPTAQAAPASTAATPPLSARDQFRQDYTTANAPNAVKAQQDKEAARQAGIAGNKKDALKQPLPNEVIDKALMAAAAEGLQTSAGSFYQGADQQYNYAPPADATAGKVTPGASPKPTTATPSTGTPPAKPQASQSSVPWMNPTGTTSSNVVPAATTPSSPANGQVMPQLSPQAQALLPQIEQLNSEDLAALTQIMYMKNAKQVSESKQLKESKNEKLGDILWSKMKKRG